MVGFNVSRSCHRTRKTLLHLYFAASTAAAMLVVYRETNRNWIVGVYHINWTGKTGTNEAQLQQQQLQCSGRDSINRRSLALWPLSCEQNVV